MFVSAGMSSKTPASTSIPSSGIKVTPGICKRIGVSCCGRFEAYDKCLILSLYYKAIRHAHGPACLGRGHETDHVTRPGPKTALAESAPVRSTAFLIILRLYACGRALNSSLFRATLFSSCAITPAAIVDKQASAASSSSLSKAASEASVSTIRGLNRLRTGRTSIRIRFLVYTGFVFDRSDTILEPPRLEILQHILPRDLDQAG